MGGGPGVGRSDTLDSSVAASRITINLVASSNIPLLALSSACQSPGLVWLGFLHRVSQG